ncbi:MAG: hypothetical protein K5785_00845 [Nitrosarchaeum sp.]|nr:hypothetical protein [Nitrosarchaeum sp.]
MQLIEIRLSPERTNIPGYYRKCADDKCNRYIPCPHVKCQEHRDDFAIKDWTVTGLEPSEVKIIG